MISLKLRNALEEIIKKECVDDWLDKPNSAFDGLTPNQIAENENEDRIWSMIYQMESCS